MPASHPATGHAVRARRRWFTEWALVTLVVLASASAATWPLVRSPRQVAAHQDPLFSAWRIDQWSRNLSGQGAGGWFGGNSFAPTGDALLLSDAMLLPNTLAVPVARAAGVLPAFTFVFWLAVLGNGWAAYALARAATGGHRLAALVAAAIFTGAPFRAAHVVHLEMLWSPWIPLAVLAAMRTMQGHRRAPWALALTLVAQMASAIYTGVYLLTLLPVIAATAWLAAGRPRPDARTMRDTVLALLLAVCLVGLYAWPYQRVRTAVGDRRAPEISRYGAEPIDYLRPAAGNRWLGWFGAEAPNEERTLSSGLVPYALAVPALLAPMTPWVAGLSAGAVVAFDASRGLGGWVYPWLQRLPPYAGLRVPARFAVFVLLAVSLLAAGTVVRLTRATRSPRMARAVTALVLAGVIAEQLSQQTLRALPATAPPLYAWLAQLPPTVVAHLPMPDPGRLPGADVEYQYFAQHHRHRLVNGYSGFYPPPYLRLLEVMRGFPSAEALDALRASGATLLAVHRQHYTPEAYAALTWWLDSRPDVVPLAAIRDEADEVRVYRMSAD